MFNDLQFKKDYTDWVVELDLTILLQMKEVFVAYLASSFWRTSWKVSAEPNALKRFRDLVNTST